MRALKSQPGRNILTDGSSQLVHGLLTHDLADEMYRPDPWERQTFAAGRSDGEIRIAIDDVLCERCARPHYVSYLFDVCPPRICERTQNSRRAFCRANRFTESRLIAKQPSSSPASDSTRLASGNRCLRRCCRARGMRGLCSPARNDGGLVVRSDGLSGPRS